MFRGVSAVIKKKRSPAPPPAVRRSQPVVSPSPVSRRLHAAVRMDWNVEAFELGGFPLRYGDCLLIGISLAVALVAAAITHFDNPEAKRPKYKV